MLEQETRGKDSPAIAAVLTNLGLAMRHCRNFVAIEEQRLDTDSSMVLRQTSR